MSAKDMWTRLENKQTKREYANYIFAREQLYANKCTRELKISEWLREMELQKLELQHYGKVISDEEFAEILLGNVPRTHREVVGQFSQHYAVLALPGAHQLAPPSAQVMIALRAEEDLNDKVAEGISYSSIGSAQKKSSNNQNNSNVENSGKSKSGKGKRQRGRGQYKSKAHKQKGKPTDSGGNKSSHGCWNWGELGHIRSNFPNSKQNEGSLGQKQTVISEYKRWQNKKSENGGKTIKSTDALTVRKIGATVVGIRRRKPRIIEWVLDTATDVHVCTNLKLLANTQPDRSHVFLAFDGLPKGERVIGDVRLLVQNATSEQDEGLTLLGAVHTPIGLICFEGALMSFKW